MVRPEIAVISFCRLWLRVWVLPSVVTLDQLPTASSDQLWLCAGTGEHGPAFELADRFAAVLRVNVFVIADTAPAAPPVVDALADPALRAHGRLGAVSDAAYVVRPDGYLAFRCDPPDADWLADCLSALGLR